MAVDYTDQAGLSHEANPSVTTKKRIRRTHPKVRTGCITCKIRRKKCDETKPHCQRCSSTGRKCDGYAIVNVNELAAGNASLELLESDTSGNRTFETGSVRQGSHDYDSRSPSSPGTELSYVDITALSAHTYHQEGQRGDSRPGFPIKINMARAPNIFPSAYTMTDLEVHCFSYFRHHTGPQLTSYFSSTMWQKYCTGVGLSHPVVFACAAAVGAVHRRFNLGISAEALRWCAHSDQLVKKARHLLITFERNVTSQDSLMAPSSSKLGSEFLDGTSGCGIDNNDILMTAHMLLFHFDSFQADFPAAVLNLRVGMNHLLLRPMRLLHSETSYPNRQKHPEAIVEFFGKLKLGARTLFGSEAEILTLTGNNLYGTLPPMPQKFDSLSQARDYIFTEVHQILCTPDRIWKSKPGRVSARTMHTTRILSWSAAYTETVLCMDRTETQKRAGSLLRTTRSLAYLLLYFALRLTAHLPRYIENGKDRLTRSDIVAGNNEARASHNKHKLHYDLESKEGDVNGDEASQSSTTTSAISPLWRTASQQEDLMAAFYRLELWADMLLNPTNPFRHVEYSASFDSGLNPPLDGLPSPQSSGKTRFMVKYVTDGPGEDLEDTDTPNHFGIYGLAEQSSAIEEYAVLEGVRSRLPPGTDLKWVDVTLFAEQRRILLQYCCSGPDVWDMVPRWVQEWWMF